MPHVFPNQNGALATSTLARPVHELFEEQAAATPDAVALLSDDQQVSYAQVNARANRLAHHLLRLGVARGNLVGLCMERCPDAIVGLLGILKAGGAYVPLDPAYPDERLSFMLRDSAAPLTLTHRATAGRMAPFARQTRILCLDTDAAAIASEPATNPGVGTGAQDLVYVMYTSGSTGIPKGVLVGHRAVVRLVRDTDYCRFGPDEVFLHLSPLAFDASTFEIWGALLNGGRLALMPPGSFALDTLGATIRRHGVTTLWLTAGLFHLVVEQRVEILGQLRQLVAGGDVLSPTHVGRVLEVLDHGVLINGYGPTESTTFACCYRMAKGYRPGDRIPIGRPIAHTSVHVLDDLRQPVPAGTPGELYIGGDGLAQGYLNDPGLTRAKFIPDPFRTDSGARLYRTGDRVRYLPDGNLEFLGRFDDQLKVSGHRIEPGEIEAILRQHAAVRQAVVIARTQSHGEKQLVAYVAGVTPGGISAAELRQYLGNRLPPYMLPAHVVPLDRLPLNCNGKVDRAALPAPDRPTPVEAGTGSPATHMEEKLTPLWGKILGCSVGPEENFFDLGGTSLQWIELHAELTKALGRELSMTAMFEHPTIRSLAGWLAGNGDFDRSFNQAQDRAKRQQEAFARQRRLRRTGA